ncbi:hypothetical protein ACFQLX_02725 [Streptomyces polyrhachis]|uniref:Uncharacterized protein n=1 Tax=Streptomyces polyrhachis TaxID=1282885 RepID=A0ABW2GEB0_9ACTN
MRQLLAGLPHTPSDEQLERLVDVVRAEVERREYAAYASGWQDAVEARRSSSGGGDRTAGLRLIAGGSH